MAVNGVQVELVQAKFVGSGCEFFVRRWAFTRPLVLVRKSNEPDVGAGIPFLHAPF